MTVPDGAILTAAGAVCTAAAFVGRAFVYRSSQDAKNSRATTEASIANQRQITNSFTTYVGELSATVKGLQDGQEAITDHLKKLCDSQPDRDILTKCIVDQSAGVKAAITEQTKATRAEHTKITSALAGICKKLGQPVATDAQIAKMFEGLLQEHHDKITADEITAGEVTAKHVKAVKVSCEQLLKEGE